MKALNRFQKNKILRGIVMITGGTAFAQFINIIISPIITRLYTPDEYGILSVYIAVVGMITIVGSFMYELAIPIAYDEDATINIIALCILILVTLSILITLILMMIGDPILRLLDAEVLLNYRLLIPVGVFFTGLYTIFIQFAYRNKSFKTIGKTKGYQSLSQGVVQIAYPFAFTGPVGLIGGRIIGQSAGFLSLAKPLLVNCSENMKKVSLKSIRILAKKYIRFPLYLMPSQFLNTASIHIPVLFLGALFDGSVVGFYGLANSMVNLPMTLIGKSVADVFYSEAASIGRTDPKKLKKLSRKILKQLVLIGVVPLVTLLLFGPFFFSCVFGDNWYDAGVYSRAIAFMVFARFIFTPVSKIYVVFERQKESLYLNILRIILAVGVFLITKQTSSTPFQTIFLYSLSMAIVYLITFVGAQKIIDSEIKRVSQINN